MHDFNFIAPTPATSDNSNQIATTAFVQAALAASNLTVGTSVITGGTTNGLLYDNAGVLGNLATANSGVLITSGAGAPSIATTLPSGLTLPAPIVTTSLTYGGVTLANSVTGTGSMVLATSPTLVTPVLGAATLTSANFNVSTTTDPVVIISFSATISDRTHGFQFIPTLTFNTNGSTGLAAFDDEVIVTGSANTLNHITSFQSFPQYSGSGVLSSLNGMNWTPAINSGTITQVVGVGLHGITVAGGSVSGNVYGILIDGIRTGGPLSGDRGIISLAGIQNEFRGNSILNGGISMATVSLTLANGLNSNITMPTSMRANVVGPTGAFSVGGFVAGADGQRLHIYNTTAQTMTLVNEDASSTAANRIKTLTGANVVLRANATSFATFSYDGLTSLRWILESSN